MMLDRTRLTARAAPEPEPTTVSTALEEATDGALGFVGVYGPRARQVLYSRPELLDDADWEQLSDALGHLADAVHSGAMERALFSDPLARPGREHGLTHRSEHRDGRTLLAAEHDDRCLLVVVEGDADVAPLLEAAARHRW